MYSVKEMFDDIVLIADMLEENEIDNFKFPKGISEEDIKDWEKENNILLPDGYRSFLLLTNGFRNHGTEIYSLEQITQLDFPEDYKGYYVIGSYIGDGSLILVDDKGGFYLGDHAGVIDKSTFEAFVEKWILDDMKDSLKDNDIKLPNNMKTNKKIRKNSRFYQTKDS
ncbi:MAG: SMI1/KNR4 family protein [Clostridiales bacterium]|nr:SMI1/KNR4 family protein [Clostridiales bacterium]